MTIWPYIMTGRVRLRNAIILIAVGIAVGVASGLLISSRDRHPAEAAGPMPVEDAAEPQAPSPAETRPPVPDLAAIADEYLLAARSVYFNYRKGDRVGKRVADYCESRLANGLPIGTAMGDEAFIKPMVKWAGQLTTEARSEYARRCLALAADVKAGREPSSGFSPSPIQPLALYAAAANIAGDANTCNRAIRLFYMDADRFHAVAMADHAAQVAKIPPPPSVWVVNPAIGAKYSRPIAQTPPAAPRRQQLCDWWEMAAGRYVQVPDPR